MNPIRWMRENRRRNLADYEQRADEGSGGNTCDPVTPSEAARILAGARDRDYEARRRALVDELRERMNMPKWRWQ